MPIKSGPQYGLMQMRAHGGRTGLGPTPEVAREMINKTPAKTRSKFAKQLGRKRRAKKY